MTLPSAITTEAEADVFNAGDVIWAALSSAQKVNSLYLATIYVRQNWRCPTTTLDDPTTIDDTVKQAVAWLALKHQTTPLFVDIAAQTTVASGQVTRQKDQVGPLLTETEYAQGSTSTAASGLASFPEVAALLSTVPCYPKGQGGSLKMYWRG